MLEQFTVKQLLIAMGLARGIKRSEICHSVSCVNSYITKTLKNDEFNKLVEKLKKLPKDIDTAEYKGLGTLFMDIGRYLYLTGEQINHGK